MKLGKHPRYPELLPAEPVWPDRGSGDDAVVVAFDLPTILHRPCPGVSLDGVKFYPGLMAAVERLVQESAVRIIRLKAMSAKLR